MSYLATNRKGGLHNSETNHLVTQMSLGRAIIKRTEKKVKEKTLTTLVEMNESDHFALVTKQAEMLANANIIPAAYRRKPADIIAAGLAGRAYGWDVMAAMRNFHVIEGTASMRPEAMLGLVRHAGHSVLIEVNNTKAVAIGRRCDTGDEHRAEFSMKDAEVAGLNQKRNWKQYGEAMLTWRAVSILCRVLFPDVVLGAGYVPEELGIENTNQNGEIIEVEFAKTPDSSGSEIHSENQKVIGSDNIPAEISELVEETTETEQLKELISSLGEVDKALLKEWWKSEGFPSIASGDMTDEQIDTVSERIQWLLG